MDIIIGNTNNYSCYTNYMLTYGNMQYHIHTIDKEFNCATLKLEFGKHNVEPKFIAKPIHDFSCIFWSIIDVDNSMHILVIKSKGKILLRKNVVNSNSNDTLISVKQSNRYCDSIISSINKDNIINLAYYTCGPGRNYNCDVMYKTNITDQNPLKTTYNKLKVNHVCDNIYFTTDDKVLWQLQWNMVIEVDDYVIDDIQSTFKCDSNNYTFNRCLNILYKNGTMIYKFKENNYMLGLLTPPQKSVCAAIFVSSTGITCLIDNNGTIKIHKFHNNHIKFIDNINVPSLFDNVTKFKSRIMTFMLANRIAKPRIPRRLLYDVICLLTKN